MGLDEWLMVRSYLRTHRRDLEDAASRHYSSMLKISESPLLTTEMWNPGRPVRLADIALHWVDESFSGAGTERVTSLSGLMGVAHIFPPSTGGRSYTRYSQAMRDLAAPKVFVDRPTYRLRRGDLRAASPSLAFGHGSYFDSIDVGEACAHEFAAATLGLVDGTPLRDAVGDPCDPGNRPTNFAISVLTLRHDPGRLAASFPLHWRDPAKVGHAGGTYTVVPVGIFQTAGDTPDLSSSSRRPARRHDPDFSLWRCIVREFAEELLGEPERRGVSDLDYEEWSMAAGMTEALQDGRVQAYCLGVGVDPLTLATDLLTVVTVRCDLYDQLFGAMVRTNEEGHIARSSDSESGGTRFPFTAESIDHLTRGQLMQAAGVALLRRAWEWRDSLFHCQ